MPKLSDGMEDFVADCSKSVQKCAVLATADFAPTDIIVIVFVWSSLVAKARSGWRSMLVPAVFVATALVMLTTSPTSGDLWWSDAPRHALNGAFVRDAIVERPWSDPFGWAVQYYLRYPAITIMFYPPLFYGVEAGMFAMLGVSHFAAQATVALFIPVLLVATYTLARSLLPRASAVGASLLLVGAPGVAFWGRQVMLDIPAFAATAAAAALFARYWRTQRAADIVLASACLLAAMYIKQTTAFMVIVFVVSGYAAAGTSWFRQRGVVPAATLGLVGAIPLALMTYWFGSVNVESLSGRPGDLSLLDPEAWLFYARRIPMDLGPITAVLAVVGLISLSRYRPDPAGRRMAVFLLIWLAVAYLFFSAIGVRQPRHGLMILLPLAVGAVVALHALLPRRLSQVAAVILGAGTLGFSLMFHAPPRLDGYGAVADYVATHAPKNAVVMFHGAGDGNFAFRMRTHDERSDITVLRTDKLLVRVVAGERERGVRESNLTQSEIEALVRELGISLVVYEPGFWSDLKPMARFAAALHTPSFKPVAHFDIASSVADDENSLKVFAPTYPVHRTRKRIELEMPMLRGSIRGTLGH